MGGAFFIEDGIETGNIIQYNLAVFVKQSTSLLNDDITPGNIIYYVILTELQRTVQLQLYQLIHFLEFGSPRKLVGSH